MNSLLTADALRRAAAIKDQIEQLEAEIKSIFAGVSSPARRGPKPGVQSGRKPGRPPKAAKVATDDAALAVKPRKKRRKMSPEARARISAGAKARWARAKGSA